VVLVSVEITIEPPDQLSGDIERLTLHRVEADQLVHQTLRVDPAQAMFTDAELASIVGQDDRTLQQTMGLDAAPDRPFRGDLPGIRLHLELGNTGSIEMV
jgi:hypothetical protein